VIDIWGLVQVTGETTHHPTSTTNMNHGKLNIYMYKAVRCRIVFWFSTH
jgi:hypothetical protein